MRVKPSDFKVMFFIMVIFYGIAISFSIWFDSVFYLYNFIIIGTSLALGIGLWPVLPKRKKHLARKVSQVLVGGYMFFGLGIGLIYMAFGRIRPENMQLEGFWFLLLAGVFAAAVMHYTIAKIIGPFLFGRAWCGWTCWTAAVLDLLPWKRSPGRLPKKFGAVKYVLFAASTVLVFPLVFYSGYKIESLSGAVDLTGARSGPGYSKNILEIPELWWFLAGNFLYYAAGIILAALVKDNRAFCKYLCPITAFLKIGSRFSLAKIKTDPDKCTDCKACEKACPMDIKITEYVKENKRITSSECILCHSCISACPGSALGTSFGFDCGFSDRLRAKSGAAQSPAK